MDWINIIQLLGFPIALIIGYFIPKISKSDESKDKWIEKLISENQKQSDRRHEGMMEGFKDLKTAIVGSFEKTFHEHEKGDHEHMEKMTNAILKHDENSMKQFQENRKAFIKMAQQVGNTVLEGEQTVRLLLTEMWFVSDAKLGFIRNLLIRNGIKIRKDSIKREIKDYLISKSDDYMSNFKTFITPVGDLSVWLDDHFGEKDFNDFLEKIYTEFFREYDTEKLSKEAIIELKINAIQSIMRHLQRNLATILKLELDEMYNK